MQETVIRDAQSQCSRPKEEMIFHQNYKLFCKGRTTTFDRGPMQKIEINELFTYVTISFADGSSAHWPCKWLSSYLFQFGIAVSKGILSLDDSVADYFKDELPPNASPSLEAMKLKHLLTMSSGFDRGLLMYPDRRKGVGFPDYLQYLLSREVHQIPGTKYCYSTGDSILAGRMCEKAAGKSVMSLTDNHTIG